MVESKESSSGGGAKYALLALLLLGASAGLIYFALGGEEQPPPEAPKQAKAEPEPAKPAPALAEPTFVVPEEEEDAGAGDAAAQQPSEPEKPRKRARRPRGPCEGEIPAREAARVVRSHERQVRACYERRLKVNNILQGRLVLRLRVGRSGNVEGVQVGGTLRDREVSACVRNVARKWQFPKPKGGCALVDAPFNLRPKP